MHAKNDLGRFKPFLIMSPYISILVFISCQDEFKKFLLSLNVDENKAICVYFGALTKKLKKQWIPTIRFFQIIMLVAKNY